MDIPQFSQKAQEELKYYFVKETYSRYRALFSASESSTPA